VPKYKKKRARELKHDKFRDTTMQVFDRLGDRLEGKGKAILYGILAVIVAAALIGFFVRWRNRKGDEARAALGRAIAITQAPVSSASPMPGTPAGRYTSHQERAQKAIEEFQKVVAKYGDPYRTEARYFIATNLLLVDRNKGISDLSELGKNSNQEIVILSKFALAQAKEADNSLDEAAALYKEVAALNGNVVTAENANLRLAMVYSKQGKKKEAGDLLFNIADAARKAKDPEGNPKPQSQAARQASQELQKLDPARYDQLTPDAVPNLPF
jgi:tetratricopeptide (TPR) repeat protein